MTQTKHTTSQIYLAAVERVFETHGKAVRATLGSTLFKALIAASALDLLAAQDDDVSDERVRELLLMVHGDIASL